MAIGEPAAVEQAELDSPFQLFQVRPELLASGKKVTVLAKSDILTGTVMVADSGGETIVHAHQFMDQLFIVLAGEATFYGDLHEMVAVLGPWEGVLVPRGATYWYEKTSVENLVLLRAAAIAQNAERETVRFTDQLRPAAPVEVIEGKHFGD